MVAGACQRIYLGVSRRKEKDKQRRAELGIKQEESEEATLPREAQGQQEVLAKNKGRVTLQYGRRQPAAERKVITGSKRINPGRAKTQGE